MIFKHAEPHERNHPTTARAHGFVAGLDGVSKWKNPYFDDALAAHWEAGRLRMSPEGKRL